jgi:phage-related protein
MSWKIILFESRRGDKPVEEFINSLSNSTAAKVAHNLDLLESYGYQLGMPHVKKIHKEIFELRIRGIDEIRVLYVFHKNRIVLLHGFKKKSQKTPEKEILTALKRLALL